MPGTSSKIVESISYKVVLSITLVPAIIVNLVSIVVTLSARKETLP
jgi:hypothetical protein